MSATHRQRPLAAQEKTPSEGIKRIKNRRSISSIFVDPRKTSVNETNALPSRADTTRTDDSAPHVHQSSQPADAGEQTKNKKGTPTKRKSLCASPLSLSRFSVGINMPLTSHLPVAFPSANRFPLGQSASPLARRNRSTHTKVRRAFRFKK